jgi:hypothetical protein
MEDSAEEDSQREIFVGPAPLHGPSMLQNYMKDSPRGSERTPTIDVIDEVLLRIVEGVKMEKVPISVEIHMEEDGGVEDGEDTVRDLFDDESLFDGVVVSDIVNSTEEERRVLNEEFEEGGFEPLDGDKYETLEMRGSEVEVVSEDRARRTRVPSRKIAETEKIIEEAREMRRILDERRAVSRIDTARRRIEREDKERRKEELRRECERGLPVSSPVGINYKEGFSGETQGSKETELGEIRAQCIKAKTLLTRKQYIGVGSDTAMMRLLHCPETDLDVEKIGNRADCKCWLCGYPMMTKTPYVNETIMVKRLHGQVSAEHTLPVMAGNSLIGLPTKEFIKKYSGNPEYYETALQFLKKGLTYSHFWCNEVKNALRLATWPHGELPKPNDANIRWLLHAMWYGIKRSKGQRWFDESTSFVIYKNSEMPLKFYTIIHYFTLREDVDRIGDINVNAKGNAWIEARFQAIRAFVQDICNDIERFTKIHFHNTYNREGTLRELSSILQEVYKDKVTRGSKSTILWPPVVGKLRLDKRAREVGSASLSVHRRVSRSGRAPRGSQSRGSKKASVKVSSGRGSRKRGVSQAESLHDASYTRRKRGRYSLGSGGVGR